MDKRESERNSVRGRERWTEQGEPETRADMGRQEKPTCRDVQSAANDDELPWCSQSG